MLRPLPNRMDSDATETLEWLDSLTSVINESGRQRAEFLLDQLGSYAERSRVRVPFNANRPYINTIPVDQQPEFPGDRAIERRIKSAIRWNATAMVVRANKKVDGIGGHIATYQSAATLWEVGFNHIFRARTDTQSGDQVFFQGHASPGIYARAFLEYRLDVPDLLNFRRELAAGGGLSSYPHPWLMPEFWQFSTVSMGLGPICSIYQARFNEYLRDRGMLDTSASRVWAFLGDGEMDEPESLGAITLASREQLGNLKWIINCNLQRLDGPVRGNGNIIQELEGIFTGAGWNVIKCIWGSSWDPLFEQDAEGALIQAMNDTVDGEWQRFSVEPGGYAREHFFGRDPRLAKLVENLTDEQIQSLRLGGHDPAKVYAAYRAAEECSDRPTVVLARTIKGYGMGDAGEARNVAHQQKKLNEEELRYIRDRFDIPVSDEKIASEAPFFRFEKGSPEYEYLMERRRALGGFLPARRTRTISLATPPRDIFAEFIGGSGGKGASTTMAYMRMVGRLLKDKEIGKYIVPIVPDEARTFGMEALFNSYGIYAHSGQHYEPIDHAQLMHYAERQNGQILQEGITEAGAMASFTAAGTAYSVHGLPMIPFFTYYSMFGFQRIGDLIWMAADVRCRGFLVGATAGRTTLNGEGLQHQDGHSHLHASTVPNCIAYDPAFAYEFAVIIREGVRRMFEEQESVFYYITSYNEVYEQPPMPEGAEAGILRGMYRFKAAESPGKLPRVHLLGSGPILRNALKAQGILREKFNVAADVWSVTSYNELFRDGVRADRWNRLHPGETPRKAYVAEQLEKEPWPVVAASDFIRAVAARIERWTPRGMCCLGTDGFGRSESRAALRDFFEISAEHIAYAALFELAGRDQFDRKKLADAIKTLGIRPDAPDPSLS